MTKLHPKKQPKAPAKTKITGTVSNSNAHYFTLQTARGAVWKIKKTPKPKVTGTLKIGSKVTVEFSKKNGQQIRKKQASAQGGGTRDAGKRTEEVGRVIGLTATQVVLDNTTPKTGSDDPFPGPWTINLDANTVIVSGAPLTLGATNVDISFLFPPAQKMVFV
jgi:hypothetical protein